MLKLDKKRFRVKHCPCGKSNKDGKFVPYIGYDTKGYCHACAQTFMPDIKHNNNASILKGNIPIHTKRTANEHPMLGAKDFEPLQRYESSLLPVNSPSYISGSLFVDTLTGYENNHFVKYLTTTFGESMTSELAARYCIGTSKYWPGATVFWQVDTHSKIRTGKIMLYNAHTGKRVKEPSTYFNWVHTLLKLPDFNLQQCLFGEHLLTMYPQRTVALVESEKTAIIAHAYMPQYIWLATGGISNLKTDRCRALAGRNVVVYPDLSQQGKTFEAWSHKAKDLFNTYRVSDMLEHIATDSDRQQGLDLADYLLRFNYTEHIKDKCMPVIEPSFFTWKQIYEGDA